MEAAMHHFSPEDVRDCLTSTIASLLERRAEFLVNPKTDFTRERKISFEQTLLFPMIAGSDNISTEILDFFEEGRIPTPSSMIQRRNQVRSSAFKEVFHQFTRKIPAGKSFYGYRTVACDGSRINLPYNPSDPDTHTNYIKGRKGINQAHLNALYDIQNDLFIDIELQNIPSLDEKGAFCRMLDRRAGSDRKTIYIADRGYASYNIFAHAVHNQQLFLIRVPESFAKAICKDKKGWLQKDEEDNEVTIHIGRCRRKENRQLENYHCVPTKGHYDFIPARSRETEAFRLRVLKFPISENTSEFIVTNLPACGFSMTTVKELYNLRWGIETAFRHLKYAGNMVHIHSLKKEFLIQEIYGKLTMYNFSSFIAVCVADRAERTTSKYSYVINHTQLQKICIRFLRGTLKNVADMICSVLVPVRPGRRFKRILRRQSADTLTYR